MGTGDAGGGCVLCAVGAMQDLDLHTVHWDCWEYFMAPQPRDPAPQQTHTLRLLGMRPTHSMLHPGFLVQSGAKVPPKLTPLRSLPAVDISRGSEGALPNATCRCASEWDVKRLTWRNLPVHSHLQHACPCPFARFTPEQASAGDSIRPANPPPQIHPANPPTPLQCGVCCGCHGPGKAAGA